MKETKSFFTKNNNLNKVGVVPKTQASKEVPFAKDLAEYEAFIQVLQKRFSIWQGVSKKTTI
ncbi:MAG UNVERIFIED_CONTAM: hypothetical protein LVQ98_02505 [Rickettsiaceae bacterium]|jgi:hypothetical protein